MRAPAHFALSSGGGGALDFFPSVCSQITLSPLFSSLRLKLVIPLWPEDVHLTQLLRTFIAA